jgi:hypothetical protein
MVYSTAVLVSGLISPIGSHFCTFFPEAEVTGFAILTDVAGHLRPPNNLAVEVCILRNIDVILEE